MDTLKSTRNYFTRRVTRETLKSMTLRERTHTHTRKNAHTNKPFTRTDHDDECCAKKARNLNFHSRKEVKLDFAGQSLAYDLTSKKNLLANTMKLASFQPKRNSIRNSIHLLMNNTVWKWPQIT